MITILIIIIVTVVWTVLSTFVYKTMTEKMDFDFDEDPLVILTTIFSPIGIFILLGVLIGNLLIKKFDEITKENSDGEN